MAQPNRTVILQHLLAKETRAFAALRFSAASSTTVETEENMQVTQESDYLYRVTRLGMINCFLVREDDGFTLVDTGLAGSASSILVIAQKLGCSVRRIVLTHAHIDHAGSLDAIFSRLSELEVIVGTREARLLGGDLSLDSGETGRKLRGFVHLRTRPTQLVGDGARVCSLRAISSPGHTPGHMAYLDLRDGSLLGGDAFTTQTGLVAAGVFKVHFPFPALFTWNRIFAAESAEKLRTLNPTRLAVGHGRTLNSPLAEMDRAIELAMRQISRASRNAANSRL